MTFDQLKVKAAKRGWKTPVNDKFPEDAWLRYWNACADYEADNTKGRPVVPH
jgi:hypothetical protein